MRRRTVFHLAPAASICRTNCVLVLNPWVARERGAPNQNGRRLQSRSRAPIRTIERQRIYVRARVCVCVSACMRELVCARGRGWGLVTAYARVAVQREAKLQTHRSMLCQPAQPAEPTPTDRIQLLLTPACKQLARLTWVPFAAETDLFKGASSANREEKKKASSGVSQATDVRSSGRPKSPSSVVPETSSSTSSTLPWLSDDEASRETVQMNHAPRFHIRGFASWPVAALATARREEAPI